MLEFVKTHIAFLLIFILWVLTGIYFTPLSLIIVVVSFFLFIKKEFYQELVIGFLGLLFLSDSYYLGFAKEVKPYVLFLVGFYFIYRAKNFRPLTRIYMPFIFFFALVFILLIRNPTPWISFQKIISYFFLYLTLPSYFFYVFREKGHKFFLDMFNFINLLLLSGFLMFFIDKEVAISHGNRYRGIMGNPNDIGMFNVVMFILYYTINDYFKGLFSKRDKLFTYVLNLSTVIWSGSRTAMICIAIFLLSKRTQKISPFLTVLVFIIIALAYTLIMDNMVLIAHAFGLDSYLRLDTIKEGSGRIHAWRFAWKHIQDNFFIGKGWDYNQYLFSLKETRLLLNPLNHEGDVHNIYLGFWLDTGLVGVILFFSALFYVFYQASRRTHLAFPALLSLLFMGMYEPWLIASMNPYTIMMLFILTVMIYCKPGVGDNPDWNNQLVTS